MSNRGTVVIDNLDKDFKAGYTEVPIPEEKVVETSADDTKHLVKKGNRVPPGVSICRRLFNLLGWIDADMKPFRTFYMGLPFCVRIPIEVIDVLLRGVGQVLVMNNSITGLFILIGLALAHWWITLIGVIGLISSTATAFIAGFTPGAIRDGLHGYNGFLTGLAIATFADIPDYWIIIPTILTSAMTSVFLSFHAQVYQVPACTLPFCFATSLFLLGSYRYSYFPEPALSPVTAQQIADPVTGVNVSDFFGAILTGVSQIFLASNMWTGALILIGMAFCSRISAIMCGSGAAIGLFYAFAMGVGRDPIYFGLWGYNCALSAICIGGLFFRFNAMSILYAIACCIGTAFIQGGLGSVFGPWGAPILTFPFNIGVLLFLVAHPGVTRFGGLIHVPLNEMVTPETTLFRSRAAN